MKKMFAYLSALIFLLACWQGSSVLLDKAFLPDVGATIVSFGENWLNGALPQALMISLRRIFWGIFWAVILAVPFGLALGRIEKLDSFCAPLIYVLYPLPKVVFLPIIVVFLGLGDAPKILLIALVVFFQILVVSRDAAKNIPAEYDEVMQVLHANAWERIKHVIVPYCLSDILTSLRITLGTGIAILFFAETFASVNGLGYFILNGMESRNYPQMYAGIIALALLGLGMYVLVDIAEKYCCRWKKY